MSSYNEYTIRIHFDGKIEYLDKDGKHHRMDGPAVEYPDGNKLWMKHGFLHCTNGPAYTSNSLEEWYFEGRCHRIGGPSRTSNTSKEWRIEGKLHREDGPAIEYANGNKEYWLEGKFYQTEESYKKTLATYKASKDSCDGKEVEIDGKKYKLVLLT